jgi:hypothetical protein
MQPQHTLEHGWADLHAGLAQARGMVLLSRTRVPVPTVQHQHAAVAICRPAHALFGVMAHGWPS